MLWCIINRTMSLAFEQQPSGFQPFKQQELEALGNVERPVLCAPTAILNRSSKEYDIDPKNYVENLPWDVAWNEDVYGWSRPGLSEYARQFAPDAAIITWKSVSSGQSFTEEGLQKMQHAGYISGQPIETEFLHEVVSQLPSGVDGAIALAKENIPVIVCVNAGFAMNKTAHAITIEEVLPDGRIRIFDPDARNPKNIYTRSELEAGLSDSGAFTVVLPRDITENYHERSTS